MKVTELKAENVKRLKAIHITIGDGVTVIGGKNGAGKTSALDSVMYALGGKKALPAKPLREGARAGKVELKLDGDPSRGLSPMTVVRTFTPSGGGQLTITTDDGFKAPSPQTILDDLRARFIDPLAFTRESPAKQRELLQELAGLDFTEQDRLAKAKYDQRTEVNRDAKRMESQLAGMTVDPDAPDEEVSVADLAEDMERANAVNAENERVRGMRVQMEVAFDQAEDNLESNRLLVARKKEELFTAEKQVAEAAEHHAKADKAAKVAVKQADALVDIDTSRNTAALSQAEAVNRRVRGKIDRNALAKAVVALTEASQQLTGELEAIAQAKRKAIAAADWPVEGLGFDDDGPTFNGFPFDQASSAGLLRVSTAMGFALTPGLPILLIRDGSLLDDDSLALMGKLAEENDGQILIERVGEGEECSVVIEDGAVKNPS